MNLRDTILAEHSKAQANRIIKWVGKSQERFDQLFDLFLNGEDLITQRAGWPMSYLVSSHPEFISKHFNKLLKNLKKPNLHNAVKRNTVRLLQDISIPKRFHGDVMNTCFEYILDPAEKVAVKAFSLSVLRNLSQQYPEILPEIRTIIEQRWEHESTAFKSRAKKLLENWTPVQFLRHKMNEKCMEMNEDALFI